MWTRASVLKNGRPLETRRMRTITNKILLWKTVKICLSLISCKAIKKCLANPKANLTIQIRVWITCHWYNKVYKINKTKTYNRTSSAKISHRTRRIVVRWLWQTPASQTVQWYLRDRLRRRISRISTWGGKGQPVEQTAQRTQQDQTSKTCNNTYNRAITFRCLHPK